MGPRGLFVFPAGLNNLGAAVSAAAAAAIDARVLRRCCSSLGQAYIAAAIAAGLKVVALLCQVRVKVIENRLVDYFRAVRQMSYWLRGLEDPCEVDDDSCTA